MAVPLKRKPLELRAVAATASVPLRLSCNWAAMNAGAMSAFTSALLERGAELLANIPQARRPEFEAAMTEARDQLDAANRITGGAAGLCDHEKITRAGGHYGAALAALATAGNCVRQSLEGDDSPMTNALANRISYIAARQGGPRHGAR